MKSQKGGKVPMLKDTLRKLYLRTHPDLFGRYPEQQRGNEESYKELLGILDAIEKHNEFPPAKILVLPFFLKTPVEGEFKEVDLQLRTTGGACNTLVEEALGRFFGDCGLPEVFQWGEGSWGKAVGKDAVENSNLGFDKEEEAREKARKEAEAVAKREEELRRSAPAYNPVDRSAPEDHSIEKVLNEMDDTLQLIAAMPYLDEDDEQQRAIKVHFEQGSGLDDLDAQGYTVKAGVIQMWQGERDLNMLIKGVNADSAIILQRILLHALDIEKQLNEIIAKGGVDDDEDAADAQSKHTSRSAESKHASIRASLGYGSALLRKGGQDRNRFGIKSSNSVYPVAAIARSLVLTPSTEAAETKTSRADAAPSSQNYLVKVRVLHGIDLHIPSTKATCQHAARPEVRVTVNGSSIQSCTAAQHARNHSTWKKHELNFRISGRPTQSRSDGAMGESSSFISMYVSLACTPCSCTCTSKTLDTMVNCVAIGEVGELQFPTKQSGDYEISRFFPVIRHQQQSSHSSFVLLPAGKVKLCIRVEIEKPVPDRVKAALGLKIARGIAWLHRHDMIHRDIKTHNILIGDDLATPNPTVKIGDLGSAVVWHQHEPLLLGEVGSSGYTAPEIFTHHGYDSKVDVWSFGIVLWELTSSSLHNRVNPFTGMTGEEFVSKVQSGCRPNFVHTHQLCVKPIVEKCWILDPSQRPNMDEVVSELEKLCTEL
ncbi:protein of unknown function DUF4460 [Phytophthora cactorum]|nr:protein of unknown function DUF4460 [Phytophthora cactorum]